MLVKGRWSRALGLLVRERYVNGRRMEEDVEKNGEDRKNRHTRDRPNQGIQISNPLPDVASTRLHSVTDRQNHAAHHQFPFPPYTSRQPHQAFPAHTQSYTDRASFVDFPMDSSSISTACPSLLRVLNDSDVIEQAALFGFG